MKRGFPPIVIEREDHTEYYSALDRAHTAGNTNIMFVELVIRSLNKAFDLLVKGIACSL